MDGEPPRRLPESKAYALLADRRRREVIRILHGFPTPLLARELAKRIGENKAEDPSEELCCRIHLSLYHVHLPKLDEADVITYEPSVGKVGRGPNFDFVVELLADAEERDDPFVGTS